MTRAVAVVCLAAGLALSPGCDDIQDAVTPLNSTSGSTRSHRAGQNCMECHRAGGEGEAVFSIAGTVYGPDLVTVNPDTDVRLSTEPGGGGILAFGLEVDALGNFYSTAPIIWGEGFYAQADGPAGSEFMASPVVDGACNGCHGVTEDRIFVD